MDDQEIQREGRARARKFGLALLGFVLGGAALGAGFVLTQGKTGDQATGYGVLAGIGFGVMIGSMIVAIMFRPNDKRWRTETAQGKRERLQNQRSRQLWGFPIAATLFLFQATRAIGDILNGQGGWSDYLSACLPVLYAWLVAAIAMGWDGRSRKNRKWLADELTLAIRARAMTAASVVLMAGLTIALGLGLWRTELGVLAIPFALTAGGATAGLRFAWLDREAGRSEDERG